MSRLGGPKSRAWALVALGGLAACDRATPASTNDSEHTATMSATKSTPSTSVRTIEPAAGAATYAVVMLHGVGADAESFLPVARAIASGLPHALILVPDGFAPFDSAPTGRQWFSLREVTDANRPARVKQAAGEVKAWLDGVLASRRLAPERVVLLGFSQGAIVASYLAAHRTPRPMALVSLSGRYADDSPPSEHASGTLPALLVHGAHDAVIPVANASEAERALSQRGVRVTTRIQPALGHGVDEAVISEVRAFLRAEIAEP
jgi:phospholipase/carboxylesterase